MPKIRPARVEMMTYFADTRIADQQNLAEKLEFL